MIFVFVLITVVIAATASGLKPRGGRLNVAADPSKFSNFRQKSRPPHIQASSVEIPEVPIAHLTPKLDRRGDRIFQVSRLREALLDGKDIYKNWEDAVIYRCVYNKWMERDSYVEPSFQMVETLLYDCIRDRYGKDPEKTPSEPLSSSSGRSDSKILTPDGSSDLPGSNPPSPASDKALDSPRTFESNHPDEISPVLGRFWKDGHVSVRMPKDHNAQKDSAKGNDHPAAAYPEDELQFQFEIDESQNSGL